MTSIAPMSSMIAVAVRNIFRDRGILFPSRVRIPKANAMSVAMGIPQPIIVFSCWFSVIYINAGITIPPMAAQNGSIASFISLSSPTMSSRFISKPMTRKNKVIKPSFIQ